MKLKEILTSVTLDPDFTGNILTDDMILAINITPGTGKVEDYEVFNTTITNVESTLDVNTQEKTYLRQGKSMLKTGAYRNFKITGDLYQGDPAQDFCMDTKYLKGKEAITDYVYFNIRTGKGEQGKASIIINSDGGGEAEELVEFDAELKSTGGTPVPFDAVDLVAAPPITKKSEVK